MDASDLRNLLKTPSPAETRAGAALTVSDVEIPGYARDIVLRLYRRPDKTGLPVVLYFHGGGFVRGSLDDAEDAYRAAVWVATRARAFGGNPKKIGVAGHDAGGQLANCLAFIARDRGDVSIAAQALFGPMLDPSMTRIGDERRLSSDITAKECAACYRAYLPQAAQRMHPYAAPLESVRLGGLPPTLIVTAQNDVLHVEAEKYAGCLIESGVLTQVIRYPDVTHAALAAYAPALLEAVRFFQCRFQARSLI